MCDVTLSVYPHRAGLKNMPGHGGIRTYDLYIFYTLYFNVCRNHLKNTSCDVGFLNKYYYHSLLLLNTLLTLDNYNKYGWIKQRYILSRVERGTKCLSLVIIPIDLLILEAILSMWCFHDNLLSIISPKYFTYSLHSISVNLFTL